jgi:LPLT family lysophospholipid transporter-like MFS transporter
MNKQIYPLLVAQFLSAFADNAILFTVIAIVMQSATLATWYVPALQSVFFIAFVVFAPWVGAFADHYAKSHILIVANLIKATGAFLLVMNVEPLIAYCIVGIGAALYSPAKYGILPEIAGHKTLVKANSWIEGSTIFAIIFGMVIGAKVADYSVQSALWGTFSLFLLSAAISILLPSNGGEKDTSGSKIVQFSHQIGTFFNTTRSRFSVLSASLFWASAASVRVIIIAWAPVVLMTETASEIAELTFFLAIGIILGSAVVPKLIPLEHLQRARIPAYFMSFFIIALSFMDTVFGARVLLFLIGMMGGLFIVPINAALQEMGQKSIGSGRAVALQNFFQNVAMLFAVGAYTYSAKLGVSPVTAMLVLGGLVFLSTFVISLRLPKTSLEP